VKGLAKDLVCDMKVDEKTANWKTTFRGKTYYFCAKECKTEFELNPLYYIGGKKSDKQGHSHLHTGC
jgi:YHS domain-containing protein